METNSCEKCDEHYKEHKDGLDFAVSAINASRPHLTKDFILKNYLDRYHGRGHRRALRYD